jgi:hypothetical protein
MGNSILEPLYPYRHLDQETLVKVQARVDPRDKGLISSVIPDLGIHTFILQHVYKRIASYIRTHNLTYNDVDQRRLLDLIGAPTEGALLGDAVERALRSSPPQPKLGGDESVLRAVEDHANQRADTKQGDIKGVKENSKGTKGKGKGLGKQGGFAK